MFIWILPQEKSIIKKEKPQININIFNVRNYKSDVVNN